MRDSDVKYLGNQVLSICLANRFESRDGPSDTLVLSLDAIMRNIPWTNIDES